MALERPRRRSPNARLESRATKGEATHPCARLPRVARSARATSIPPKSQRRREAAAAGDGTRRRVRDCGGHRCQERPTLQRVPRVRRKISARKRTTWCPTRERCAAGHYRSLAAGTSARMLPFCFVRRCSVHREDSRRESIGRCAVGSSGRPFLATGEGRRPLQARRCPCRCSHVDEPEERRPSHYGGSVPRTDVGGSNCWPPNLCLGPAIRQACGYRGGAPCKRFCWFWNIRTGGTVS
jgi:hypothetical protein